MSIEQVRKVLDKRFNLFGQHAAHVLIEAADDIHAIYASDDTRDDVDTLARAIGFWDEDDDSHDNNRRLAAAILRAIRTECDARVGAKGNAGRGLADDIARRFLISVSTLLTELVPDWCDGDLEVDAKNAIRALAAAKATAEREVAARNEVPANAITAYVVINPSGEVTFLTQYRGSARVEWALRIGGVIVSRDYVWLDVLEDSSGWKMMPVSVTIPITDAQVAP